MKKSERESQLRGGNSCESNLANSLYGRGDHYIWISNGMRRDNRSGLAMKNADTQRYARAGWKVISESIEPGRFKGEKACCLAMMCLPCGFVAGSTTGYIVVTYGKD